MNVSVKSASGLCKRLIHSFLLCTSLHVKAVPCIIRKSYSVTNIECTLNLERMAPEIFTHTAPLDPPASVRGMKTLDRDAFHKEVEVPYVVTSPEKIKDAVRILKPFFLKIRKFEPVQECDGNKTVFLNPLLTEGKISAIEKSLVAENICDTVSFKKISLTYENWNYDDIFKAIFPSDIHEGVAGFSIIGHILHLNLKQHVEEYKQIIGQVFLDKMSRIKTVINKATSIDNTFRNFQMEVLAGEREFNVTVKENGLKYELDFSEVFWNPRLGTEHCRIVNKLKPGDVVFDIFAGVGPFAIPAAKKKCCVYANDLNPHSFKWLCHNAKLNKVDSNMEAHNLDGRDFITTVIKDKLRDLWLDQGIYPAVHIIMNLPAFSFDFLNAFQNLLPYFNDDVHQQISMPIVHCYFFSKKDSSMDDTRSEIEKILSCEMKQHILELLPVRAVAPSKNMMCISFTLPDKVLFCNSVHVTDGPPSKKIKVT